MSVFKNNLSRIFRLTQRSRYGFYDTFGYCSKGKINRRLCSKKARRRFKDTMKFYEGFEEFIEEQRKNNVSRDNG